MCIRDSTSTASKTLPQIVFATTSHIEIGSSVSMVPQCSQRSLRIGVCILCGVRIPVSYTHLTRETAAFALTDPSVKVRAVAFSNLMWLNTDPETTKLLTEVDDKAFELAMEDAPLRLSLIHI